MEFEKEKLRTVDVWLEIVAIASHRILGSILISIYRYLGLITIKHTSSTYKLLAKRIYGIKELLILLSY